MKIRTLIKVLLPCALAAVIIVVLMVVRQPAESGAGGELVLKAPPFLSLVRAASASGVAAIPDEAGISAYLPQKVGGINLDLVRPVLVNPVEGDGYLIGEVRLTNYAEAEDPQVFVHQDGWILAYYPADDPTLNPPLTPIGKIFDWKGYIDAGKESVGTKLELALGIVGAQVAVPVQNVTFYHFRYPAANRLLLVVEWDDSGEPDSFQVRLPGSFSYSERSWSMGCPGWGYLRLNGQELNYCNNELDIGRTQEGILTQGQLPADQLHTFQVDRLGADIYAGLAILYTEP